MDTPNSPVAPVSPPNKEVNTNVLMGVLSYLGVLVIIPYLMSKDVPFVKFHIKQGLVLVVIEIVLWALSGMLGGLMFILHIATIVLSVIGIINVLQNKEKELPLIGSFSKHINI